MDHLLREGERLQTRLSGQTCLVGRFLGEGAQGEVHEAEIGGQSLALKWYFPESGARPSVQALMRLIEAGRPDEHFLWPIDVVDHPGQDTYGYLMPLRDRRFRSVVDLVAGRLDPTFRTLARCGMELSAAFSALHGRGLQYADISWGNIHFDPANGDILICDNDNVTVNKAESLVLGTPRFMAPEIVRGQQNPSRDTDLYSLAILLFSMFTRGHPLDGKREAEIHCFDATAMRRLYGEQPVFVFDPKDDSNRPHQVVHASVLSYWPIYPKFFQQLFIQSFTAGLTDSRNGRVGDTTWRRELARLRDWIVYCQQCGKENFYDVDAMRNPAPRQCWSCKAIVQMPPRIRIAGDKIVMLNHNTQLYPHHVDDRRLYDFSQPVAAVTRNPRDPSIWGLKNLSSEKWVTTSPNGKMTDVEPGRSFPLSLGVRINLGSSEAEIRV